MRMKIATTTTTTTTVEEIKTKVEARPSTLGIHAGMGLFALIPFLGRKHNRDSIRAGDVITEYTGRLLTRAGLMKRYPLLSDREYVLQVSSDCYIDGRELTTFGLGRYINEARPGDRILGQRVRSNAYFSVNPARKTATVRALCTIPIGAEIFLIYRRRKM